MDELEKIDQEVTGLFIKQLRYTDRLLDLLKAEFESPHPETTEWITEIKLSDAQNDDDFMMSDTMDASVFVGGKNGTLSRVEIIQWTDDKVRIRVVTDEGAEWANSTQPMDLITVIRQVRAYKAWKLKQLQTLKTKT